MSVLDYQAMENKNKTLNWILILAIVAVAFFLRIYNIENIPAGIYPDESVNGTDALNANATGDYRWFYTNNYGREGLFMNLIAISIKIFGNTVLGLKIWSIIFGTLTVFGVYLLTKELFRSQRSGFLAAYLMAFSFWAINFSRISFRAIMLPFILTFTFYFLFKAIHNKKYIYFILAGLIYGVGMHTYIAYRVSPLILVLLLIYLTVINKSFLRNYWKGILLFILAAALAAAPILVDFYRHPEYFETRSNAISVFSPEVNKGHPIPTLMKSLGMSLIKYNFWGDQNWRHNYPPYPVLDPITGLAFLIGMIYLVAKIIHLVYLRFSHQVRDEKLVIYLFLASWFLIMLMPEFLTAEGLPHALRSIGTLPVVCIIAVIPILWVLGKAEKHGYFFKTAVFSLIIFALATIGIFNTVKYFYFWAGKIEQHGQFGENLKNMAVYLNSLPPEINKYVYPNGNGKLMEDGLPVSAQVIKYLTYGKSNPHFLTPDTELKRPLVIVLMNYDQPVIDHVKNFFPQAKIEKVDLNPGYASDFNAIIIK
jgi:4-amino-4-deoxy-L-arabinose transferase-like glycosyltransferase